MVPSTEPLMRCAVLCRAAQAAPTDPIDAPVHLYPCNWLNISACPATVRLSEDGKGILVSGAA